MLRQVTPFITTGKVIKNINSRLKAIDIIGQKDKILRVKNSKVYMWVSYDTIVSYARSYPRFIKINSGGRFTTEARWELQSNLEEKDTQTS